MTAWGAPTFRVRNRLFAMYASADTHHGAGRPAVWCKAGPGNQEFLVRSNPTRYFVPPYVGPSGWVGVWLDRRPRWGDVEDLLAEAYRLVARRTLLTGRAVTQRPAASPVKRSARR